MFLFKYELLWHNRCYLELGYSWKAYCYIKLGYSCTGGCRAFYLFASPSLFSKICLLLPDFGTPISPRIRRFSADFMPKLTSACQILKASTLRFTVKACKRAKIQYVKCPTQNALGRRRVKRGFIVLCALM